MYEELRDEMEAINSIYGPGTIRCSDEPAANAYILSIPNKSISLRATFPEEYPKQPPQILGVHSAGGQSQKGEATRVFRCAQETLTRIFSPGYECILQLLQKLEETVSQDRPAENNNSSHTMYEGNLLMEDGQNISADGTSIIKPTWQWIKSDPLTVKKSVFLAHVCGVRTSAEAQEAVASLITEDKRVAKATHNITAYRIKASLSQDSRASAVSSHERQLIFQDCNDDGESAAGGRLLHLLQAMDVWGLLVVVSRWYGGVKLGPDRFKCISEVARDAITRGGWIRGNDTRK